MRSPSSWDTLLGQFKSLVDMLPYAPGVCTDRGVVGRHVTVFTEQFRDLGWEKRDSTTNCLLTRHRVIVSVRGPLQPSQPQCVVDGNTLMLLDPVRPCVEGPGRRSAEVGTTGFATVSEKYES